MTEAPPEFAIGTLQRKLGLDACLSSYVRHHEEQSPDLVGDCCLNAFWASDLSAHLRKLLIKLCKDIFDLLPVEADSRSLGRQLVSLKQSRKLRGDTVEE